MAKNIRLVLAGENVTAIALLLESEAPRTCDMVWQALPLEGELIHAMWSGPETYLPIDPHLAAPPEHQSIHPLPGEIGFYSLPGGRMVGWPEDMAELAFFYDRGARPSMPVGPVAMNIFARIVENLEGFAEICARTQREGVKRLSVARA